MSTSSGWLAKLNRWSAKERLENASESLNCREFSLLRVHLEIQRPIPCKGHASLNLKSGRGPLEHRISGLRQCFCLERPCQLRH